MTSRENDLLRLVMIGESNKAIARQLHIEVGTVEPHVSPIMTRLGAAPRTQAASIAASRRLVEERASVLPSPFASHVGLCESRARLARALRVDHFETRARGLEMQ